jgi:hypothetical protein
MLAWKHCIWPLPPAISRPRTPLYQAALCPTGAAPGATVRVGRGRAPEPAGRARDARARAAARLRAPGRAGRPPGRGGAGRAAVRVAGAARGRPAERAGGRHGRAGIRDTLRGAAGAPAPCRACGGVGSPAHALPGEGALLQPPAPCVLSREAPCGWHALPSARVGLGVQTPSACGGAPSGAPRAGPDGALRLGGQRRMAGVRRLAGAAPRRPRAGAPQLQ